MKTEPHDRQCTHTKGATAPNDMHRLFADAFNAHDLDALVALYEPEAVLVPQPNQHVMGRKDIRQALSGFLASFQTIVLTTRGIVERADTALLYSEFHLSGTAPDGAPVTLEGRGTEVARRQAYGTWLFVIDDPFSTA